MNNTRVVSLDRDVTSNLSFSILNKSLNEIPLFPFNNNTTIGSKSSGPSKRRLMKLQKPESILSAIQIRNEANNNTKSQLNSLLFEPKSTFQLPEIYSSNKMVNQSSNFNRKSGLISKQSSKESCFFSQTVDSTNFEDGQFIPSNSSPTMKIPILENNNRMIDPDQISKLKKSNNFLALKMLQKKKNVS